MTVQTDLVIVGGGPAGLSAAIYAARFRLDTVVVAQEPGGTLAKTHLVENWPGEKSISGADLMSKILEHAESSGAKIEYDLVKSAEKKGAVFSCELDSGEKIESKAIILATGSKPRKLGAPGEDEFFGKGVSYCAVCDGMFFKDKTVAVLGGSDSAAKAAIYLADIAKEVYVIYRREKIRAEPINLERLESKKNVTIITKTNVTGIMGENLVKSLKLDNKYKGSDSLSVDGVFVEIGHEPQSELARELGAKLSENGEVITGPHGKTNIDGLFCAGDLCAGSFKQAITAAAAGANAADSVYSFLSGNEVKTSL